MLWNFNVHSSHLEVLVKHRFWYSILGVGPEIWPSWQTPKWSHCSWSGDHVLRNRAEGVQRPVLWHLVNATQEATWKTATHEGRGSQKGEAPKEKKQLKLERKQRVKNRVIVLLGMKGMKKFKKEECCYVTNTAKGWVKWRQEIAQWMQEQGTLMPWEDSRGVLGHSFMEELGEGGWLAVKGDESR